MRAPRARLASLASPVSLAGLLPVQASAQVVLDQWGTFATTVSSDCADFCDPDTDVSWLLGLTFGPQNGGEVVDVTDSTIDGVRGDAFADSLGTLSVRFDASDAANLEVASGVGAPVPALGWPLQLALPVALVLSAALVGGRQRRPAAA